MSEQTPLRVGIVGCGYQGGRLAQTIARVSGLKVTACADINLEAARRLAASAVPATAHPSVDDLLANADVDVVMVATSHDALAEVSRRAIAAGKSVMAEKPIGVNEGEAIELEQMVAQTGVTYMAGYSFRYVAALQQVKRLVEAGAVGEILAVTGAIGTGPMSQGWRAQPAMGGGPLLYIGSHLVDQVLWLVQDDPIEVFANVRTRPDTGADETSMFQVAFARGVSAQCLVTQTADAFFNTLEIHGRAGRLSLRGLGFLDYEIALSSKAVAAYADPTVIRPRLFDDRVILMHVPQLEEFAAAVRVGQQPSITVQDGRRVLQIIDAVHASDAAGEPVQLSSARQAAHAGD